MSSFAGLDGTPASAAGTPVYLSQASVLSQSPPPAAKEEDKTAAGQLGLSDWMNLAYTLSTMVCP
jgi:hypothetical protein